MISRCGSSAAWIRLEILRSLAVQVKSEGKPAPLTSRPRAIRSPRGSVPSSAIESGTECRFRPTTRSERFSHGVPTNDFEAAIACSSESSEGSGSRYTGGPMVSGLPCCSGATESRWRQIAAFCPPAMTRNPREEVQQTKAAKIRRIITPSALLIAAIGTVRTELAVPPNKQHLPIGVATLSATVHYIRIKMSCRNALAPIKTAFMNAEPPRSSRALLDQSQKLARIRLTLFG